MNLWPRVVWRHALGWPQRKLAPRFNTLHPGARLSDSRVSEFEAWPHGGSPPSLRYLARPLVSAQRLVTSLLRRSPEPAYIEDAAQFLTTDARTRTSCLASSLVLIGYGRGAYSSA